ncbi:hypothetical protein GBL14_05435, partial [Bifidobacterium longum]
FVSVASGHLTLLAVGQVLQRSLEPALKKRKEKGGRERRGCSRPLEGAELVGGRSALIPGSP